METWRLWSHEQGWELWACPFHSISLPRYTPPPAVDVAVESWTRDGDCSGEKPWICGRRHAQVKGRTLWSPSTARSPWPWVSPFMLGIPRGGNASSNQCAGGVSTAPSSPKEETERGHLLPGGWKLPWGQQGATKHTCSPCSSSSPPDAIFLNQVECKMWQTQAKNPAPNPKIKTWSSYPLVWANLIVLQFRCNLIVLQRAWGWTHCGRKSICMRSSSVQIKWRQLCVVLWHAC